MRQGRLLAGSLAAVLAGLGLLSAPQSGAAAPQALQTRTQVSAHIEALRKSTWKVVTDSDNDLVPKADYRVIRERGVYLLAQLKKKKDALSAAVGAVAVDAVGKQVDAIAVLSSRFSAAAAMDRQALSDMASAALKGRTILTAALTAQSTGSSAYRTQQTAWAGAGTWAAKDRTAALLAIPRGLPAPTRAYPAQAARATAGSVVTPAAGLTGVPGGCALPSANANTWLGSATTPGLRAWTGESEVADYNDRVAQGTDAELVAANSHALWSATQVLSDTPDDTNSAMSIVGDLGFLAMAGANAQKRSEAKDALLRVAGDLLTMPVDLSKANDLVDGSFYLWTAASALNWAQPGGTTDSATSERLWVQWMGPYTCVLARGDSSMSGSNNIAVTLNTAVAMTALIDGSSRPAIAAAIVRKAVTAALPGLRVIAADGGTPEGPTYWNLQTVNIAGLYSTWDQVFGLDGPLTLPDMTRTATWAFQLTDHASGITSTYSDAKNQTKPLRSPLPAWVAHTTPTPESVLLAKDAAVNFGIQQVWWPESDPGAPVAGNALFPTSGVAVLRSSTAMAWVTAGVNASAHTHLHAGSVSLIRNGVQWSVDPGSGSYSQPGYFDTRPDGKRWTYFHPGVRAHSTLSTAVTSTNPGQVVNAATAMTLQNSTVSVSMKPALAHVGAATRVISIDDSGVLTITDTISAAPALTWRWVTAASAQKVGSSVVLTRDGQSATISFAGLPSAATISIVPSGAVDDLGSPISIVQVALPAGSTTLIATIS